MFYSPTMNYRTRQPLVTIVGAFYNNAGGSYLPLAELGIDPGKAYHVVARLSPSPITNLHLLNERREVEAIQQRMSNAAWQTSMQTCERVMRLFPGSFYAGIDLLITADYQQHAVLEVNAFGDLLPGVWWQGQDSYTAEIKAMLARTSRCSLLARI